MSRFQMLVGDIRKSLGPSGLTSDKVNVQELSTMMERYVSQPKDWTRYALSNDKMPYTRNLVDDCNDQANLLVLVWTPGKGSPIHDHGNAHCLMKILHGNLTETRYDFPNGIEKPMQVKSERVLKQNSVAYMADELGLHRVSNQGNDFAVSLHLYTPPNVARQGCNIFNPETGKKTHIAKCGNYSAFGRRLA
ncbi:RmlC-like cupin domain-containing protein [Xylariaceae sp. FL1019]|nr:RmlC-like cupin domain-containing protein [Xylariaceae sp. FL1019]